MRPRQPAWDNSEDEIKSCCQLTVGELHFSLLNSCYFVLSLRVTPNIVSVGILEPRLFIEDMAAPPHFWV